MIRARKIATKIEKFFTIMLCLFLWGEALTFEGPDPGCVSRADSLKVIAGSHKKAGEYDSAALHDSLSARAYRECGETLEEARALERTGFYLWRMGQLNLALGFYHRARKLYVDHGDPSDMASVLNRTGLVHFRREEADSALEMFDRVVHLGMEMSDSTTVARGLGNAGMVYRQQGRLAEALANYGRCLSIHRLKDNERKQALALGNMGVVFSSRGQYREALLCFQEALDLSRKVDDKRTEGRVLGNMGVVYWNLGQFDDAYDLHMGQLNTARQLQNRIEEATSLDNLGNIQWAMGDYQGALRSYEEALTVYRELGNRRNEGIIVYDIAQVYLSLNDLSRANDWASRALEIHRAVGDRWGVALSLTVLGDIQLAGGNNGRAAGMFSEALDLAGECGFGEIFWYSKFGMARTLEAQGDTDGSMDFYRGAIEEIENIRSRINIESLSARYLQDKIEPYVGLAKLLIEAGKIEEAFGVSEGAHARTLLDIMSSTGLEHSGELPGELLKKRIELEGEINQLDRALLSAYSKPAHDINSEQVRETEKALTSARKRYEGLCREIDLKVAGLRGTPEPVEPVGIRELRETVTTAENGVVMLEYLVGEQFLVSFAVTADTLVAEVADVGRGEITRLAEEFRQPYADLKSGKVDMANLTFPVETSRTLYDLAIKPFEDQLEEQFEDASILVVVPDGPLHYVPFEALVSGRESKNNKYDYVLDHFTVAYAPSASIMHHVRRGKKERRYRGELYALGDPLVGEERMIFPYVSELLRVLRGDLAFSFSPLPGARNEVERIKTYFGLREAIVLTGPDATEYGFKKDAPGHRLVHLASHGVADDREPLYSKLVLAVDENGVDDGFLHAYEISRMNLDCELVVLSACETAIGVLSGGEGLLGLSRSFLHAGSSSVVASLWSVDESTEEVMAEFYRHLGEGKGNALRKAKLKVRRMDRDGMSLAHPFFWAPFVLIGDWE